LQVAVLSDGEIATGIAQHPVTKRWQIWVSLKGTDITYFTAHRKGADAVMVDRDIAATWKSGNLKTQVEVTTFLKTLPSDGLVDPLPPKVVNRLSKLIRNGQCYEH
jgi:hypothetical protein